MSTSWMPRNLGVNLVELANPGRGQDFVDGTGREHAPFLQHHQRLAQSGGEVEIVCRYDDSEIVRLVQRRQKRGHLQLVFQVQRGGGFIE